MTKTLTFLHAADLHIGASFKGIRALSNEWAKRLCEAIINSYDRVIETAISRHVDFVVISGDIFDSTNASYANYQRFFQGLRRLDKENIPVYMCCGNHDPYASWQRDFGSIPQNTTLFYSSKPHFALYRKGGVPYCVLAGRSFNTQGWPVDKDIAEGITYKAACSDLEEDAYQAPFSVAVLHTGLNLDLSKAPTNPDKLLGAGFDYWALGHIHKKMVMPKDNPCLAYSGCIQGLNINETGPRGVYIVTLSEGASNKVEFVPTASIVWAQIDVDVSDCETLDDVSKKIVDAMFAENALSECEEICIRVNLVGSTVLHDTLRQLANLRDLRDYINNGYRSFFCDALIDKTTMPLDKDKLMAQGLFPAVFLEQVNVAKDQIDISRAYIADEFNILKQSAPSFSDEEVLAMINESENYVFDLLRDDGKQ